MSELRRPVSCSEGATESGVWSVAGMGGEAVRVAPAWNGPSVGEQGRKDGDTSILSSPH